MMPAISLIATTALWASPWIRLILLVISSVAAVVCLLGAPLWLNVDPGDD